MPLDAFQKFTLTASDVQGVKTQDSLGAKAIALALQRYAFAQTATTGTTNVSVPDLAAAMYAVDSSLGTAESALVKVVTQPGLARGETLSALTLNERLSTIASDA